MGDWTVEDVLGGLPSPAVPRLDAPPYAGTSGAGLGLAVASMRDHTTDEGWQLFDGLASAGYALAGHALTTVGPDGRRARDLTDVRAALDFARPGVVVVQDVREWDVRPGDFREPLARFTHVAALAGRPDVFRLTVLKDAQQRPGYHRDSAAEIGCHAWVVYYHPRIVCRLAPYLRPGHLVRTWHTLDPAAVPAYSPDGRAGCLLSGAVSEAYPLRQALTRHVDLLPGTTYLKHPGYHRRGCATPGFLRTLSRYRVAVCTASRYGYALRKLVEATAAGCAVVTDLPVDEVMPEIDGNLHRVHPATPPAEVGKLIARLCRDYDPAAQRDFAGKALAWYDFRAAGARLAADIEALRRGYP